MLNAKLKRFRPQQHLNLFKWGRSHALLLVVPLPLGTYNKLCYYLPGRLLHDVTNRSVVEINSSVSVLHINCYLNRSTVTFLSLIIYIIMSSVTLWDSIILLIKKCLNQQ